MTKHIFLGKTQTDVKNTIDESEEKESKGNIAQKGQSEEAASDNHIGNLSKSEPDREGLKKRLNPQGRILVEADDNTEVSGATNEYLESDKSNMPLVSVSKTSKFESLNLGSTCTYWWV